MRSSSMSAILNTKNASAFLPEVLSATLTGTLDGFAGRISSLLFKQGVDINLMATRSSPMIPTSMKDV
jgi:hypothetical protein